MNQLLLTPDNLQQWYDTVRSNGLYFLQAYTLQTEDLTWLSDFNLLHSILFAPVYVSVPPLRVDLLKKIIETLFNDKWSNLYQLNQKLDKQFFTLLGIIISQVIKNLTAILSTQEEFTPQVFYDLARKHFNYPSNVLDRLFFTPTFLQNIYPYRVMVQVEKPLEFPATYVRLQKFFYMYYSNLVGNHDVLIIDIPQSLDVIVEFSPLNLEHLAILNTDRDFVYTSEQFFDTLNIIKEELKEELTGNEEEEI